MALEGMSVIYPRCLSVPHKGTRIVQRNSCYLKLVLRLLTNANCHICFYIAGSPPIFQVDFQIQFYATVPLCMIR